jgi:hypothetical protein
MPTRMSNRKRSHGARSASAKNRKPKGMARRSSAVIPRPPQLNGYQLTHNKSMRFQMNSNFSGSISFQNILDTILFTISATQPYDLFLMVKVRRVRVWTLPAIGSSNAATVIFDGTTAGSQGDRIIHTDNSMGIEPGYITCSPAGKSLASMFQLSSTAVAFFLYAPSGSVIDLDLSFKADLLQVAQAAQNASVAAPTGVIALRGLDGLPVATTKFIVPQPMEQI